jgi:hypothetical protein
MADKQVNLIAIREMPQGKRCELARITKDREVQLFLTKDARLVVRQSLVKNPFLFPDVFEILKGQRELHLRATRQ